MTILIFCVVVFLSVLLGALGLRYIQEIFGGYDKIKLPPGWLCFFIGPLYMWKKYKPANDTELKFLKNKIRTEYPVLTMSLEPRQNVVLNHRTMHINIGDVMSRFVRK